MTVDGPIDPSTLGVTLVHEHLHMDARPLLARVHGYEVSGTAAITSETAAEARWSPGASSGRRSTVGGQPARRTGAGSGQDRRRYSASDPT